MAGRRAEIINDPGLRGRALCQALAGVTDAWLAEVYAEAAGRREKMALVAVGGHGRGGLAPGSDLDLLLLHEGAGDVGAVAERLWYPVWDAGLKLGHAVRTLRQALDLASTDLDTATALLAVRHIGGDARLSDVLARRAAEQWRKRSGRLLADLRARVEGRHAEHGEVAFLLEPQLKEGRGGLRDVQALGWAEATRPVLLDGDHAALAEAEDVLLDVRVALHTVTGRAQDRLLLDHQDDVATALGWGSPDELMARVAAAARTVSWLSDDAWRRLAAAPSSRIAHRDRPVGPGVVVRDREVTLAPAVDVTSDPSLVLRLAAAAAGAGLPIARSTLDRLGADAPFMPRPWPAAAREALIDLLAAGHAAVPVWEALDQRHLIERVLPEWAPLRSRPQRNALHRFTVDRHLVEAAANAAALTNTVARPDLLLVGALLHDVGKGQPGDHTQEGMRLVADIAPRLGFDEEDTAVLVALVRHHLLLPEVATRRDLDDESVVAGVAEQLGSLLVLDLLLALTEADALATGPAAWSSWKADLVATLGDRVARVLRGAAPADATSRPSFPDAEVTALLERRSMTVRASHGTLTVVAPDRPGLLSRIAGMLALKGVAVVTADAVSTDDGMAASRLRVEQADGVDWEDVAQGVRRAVEGRLALEARLADRARSRRPRATLAGAPVVRVDNHGSEGHTIVEVRVADQLGVLYRITRALADLDLDIRIARVATMGHEVVDTFYVLTATGGKLVDPGDIRELERAVLHQLSLA